MVSLFVFYGVETIWQNEEKSEKTLYDEPGNLKEEFFCVCADSWVAVKCDIENKAACGHGAELWRHRV